MQLMICIRGEEEQLCYLDEIRQLGAGIELGSYGLIGIQSEKEWENRFSRHQVVVSRFKGPIALHGPFIGMEFAHIDHMIRQVVEKRIDMIFDVAKRLGACRVVLHSGFSSDIELFQLQDAWMERNCHYWSKEIQRWENANIHIVLENDTNKSPDLFIQLVDKVNNPFLGVCLDVGHLNVFSPYSTSEWVSLLGSRIHHFHLHDNDGKRDHHWPIGKGNIDFDTFFNTLEQYTPNAILSLEVADKMEVKMDNLRELAERFHRGEG